MGIENSQLNEIRAWGGYNLVQSIIASDWQKRRRDFDVLYSGALSGRSMCLLRLQEIFVEWIAAFHEASLKLSDLFHFEARCSAIWKI